MLCFYGFFEDRHLISAEFGKIAWPYGVKEIVFSARGYRIHAVISRPT
jgi:hypothetical protein